MDTTLLYDEYLQEDKNIYERLYSEYIGNIDGYLVHSKCLPKLSWCVHDIIIELNCYPSPVETYFYSAFDMAEYSKELRKDPIIRRFTKLCFYIQDNIKPYTPDLID